jgi:hypothetical protein
MAAALAWPAAAAWADCRDPFGRPEQVLDFHVQLTRTDWRALQAFTLRSDDCDGSYPEFRAQFRCGDEPWIPVALQKKRGTERGVEAPEKPPLKLQFDEDFMGQVPAARGQRWPAALGARGYRSLALNNGQANKPPGTSFLLPVLLKEHVALRLLHREIPLAPATAYAKLFLHFDDRPEPEYHGVYILIEEIDRAAIARRAGEARSVGTLVKKTRPGCAPEVRFDDGPPNASRAAFDTWAAKQPAGSGWLAETAQGLDLETLLRQEAIREILVNGTDTILNNTDRLRLGNNYLAFDPRAGALRQYIPWDVDQAFGHLQGLCSPTAYKCPPDQPLLEQCDPPLANGLATLARQTVCRPDIQRRYLEIMCELVSGSLAAPEILTVWDEADAAVRPLIPLERGPIWGGRDPLDPTIDLGYGAEYARIRAWIPRRIESVRDQLAARGVPCPEDCPSDSTRSCAVLGCEGVRRCQGGRWTPCELPGTCFSSPPEAPVGGGQAPGTGAPSPPQAPAPQRPGSGERAPTVSGCSQAPGGNGPGPLSVMMAVLAIVAACQRLRHSGDSIHRPGRVRAALGAGAEPDRGRRSLPRVGEDAGCKNKSGIVGR